MSQWLEDGLVITAGGDLGVYAKYGRYQLKVRSIQLEGMGEHRQRFQKLFKKIKKLGWFHPRHKKNMPKSPTLVAVVTSADCAAYRDFISVVRRRNSNITVALFDSQVQGDQCHRCIADAIQRADTSQVDIIAIVRGGGNYEDLQAFNRYKVVHAIHQASTPIVTGIGHQIDVTLSDKVADLSAATPSMAGEICSPPI